MQKLFYRKKEKIRGRKDISPKKNAGQEFLFRDFSGQGSEEVYSRIKGGR